MNKEQEKEQEERNSILKSQQKALDDCVKKVDVIFDMRVNGEISSQK